MKYTANEMMALSAGRMIKDGDIVFAGTGLSILAATAAKRIYAPKSVVFFETGGIDPTLDEMPMAVADLRTMSGAALNSGLIESFSIVGHKKLHTIAFLGAAQIDRYGNLNTTCIGDYHRPEVRFSGSGGANDVASLASSVITFMKHEKKRFVEKLHYMTSVGWYKGYDSRSKLGLKRGGVYGVVTNLCVMKFDEITKEIYLAEVYPGVSIEDVVKNTGFEIDTSRAVESSPPTEKELRILREEVDPQKLVL
ncbi:MAG: CoA-transferase subunit beta [Syntrophorhabdaceae bacterium]|nr:CoA-transferase subunit beta [Syntrophorhabdaceae bacterium]